MQYRDPSKSSSPSIEVSVASSKICLPQIGHNLFSSILSIKSSARELIFFFTITFFRAYSFTPTYKGIKCPAQIKIQMIYLNFEKLLDGFKPDFDFQPVNPLPEEEYKERIKRIRREMTRARPTKQDATLETTS